MGFSGRGGHKIEDLPRTQQFISDELGTIFRFIVGEIGPKLFEELVVNSNFDLGLSRMERPSNQTAKCFYLKKKITKKQYDGFRMSHF